MLGLLILVRLLLSWGSKSQFKRKDFSNSRKNLNAHIK